MENTAMQLSECNGVGCPCHRWTQQQPQSYFDIFDNFYAAIAVVRGALPQTYQEIVENPEGCKLTTRIINRLREAALAEIPYGAVNRNRAWDGKRA